MTSENERKKKTEITIRQMEIDDISAVYHLGEELFTSEEFPILYRTWDAYEVTDYFSSDPDYCLVAEVDGRIAGFTLANTIEKEGTAWKKYGYLAWIGVDEAFQRSNLGIADTDVGNKGAIAFFETLGFTDRAKHVWLAKTLRRPDRRTSKEKV
jgi:ribosomal protein S18 acetylase RimI-like enzyme